MVASKACSVAMQSFRDTVKMTSCHIGIYFPAGKRKGNNYEGPYESGLILLPGYEVAENGERGGNPALLPDTRNSVVAKEWDSSTPPLLSNIYLKESQLQSDL